MELDSTNRLLRIIPSDWYPLTSVDLVSDFLINQNTCRILPGGFNSEVQQR